MKYALILWLIHTSILCADPDPGFFTLKAEEDMQKFPGFLLKVDDLPTLEEENVLGVIKKETGSEYFAEMIQLLRNFGLALLKEGVSDGELRQFYVESPETQQLPFAAIPVERRKMFAEQYLLKAKPVCLVKIGSYYKYYPFSPEMNMLRPSSFNITFKDGEAKFVVDFVHDFAIASRSQMIFEAVAQQVNPK